MVGGHWVIHVQNLDHLYKWSHVIQNHNDCPDKDTVGETILVDCIIRFKKLNNMDVASGLYLVVFNLGCRCKTTAYLLKNREMRDRIIAFACAPAWSETIVPIWMPTLACTSWPDESIFKEQI